jgi:hypothetical protein
MSVGVAYAWTQTFAIGSPVAAEVMVPKKKPSSWAEAGVAISAIKQARMESRPDTADYAWRPPGCRGRDRGLALYALRAIMDSLSIRGVTIRSDEDQRPTQNRLRDATGRTIRPHGQSHVPELTSSFDLAGTSCP